MDSIFGEPISVYTRADAIEDGILCDLMDGPTAKLVKEAGFTVPVAMTSAAFCIAVWPVDDPDAQKWLKDRCQDPEGRLWDVLFLLNLRIKAAREPAGTEIRFVLSLVRHDTKPRGRQTMALKALSGPGDNGEHVITIMLPEED